VGVAIRRVASAYDVFPGAASTLPSIAASLTGDGNPLGEERAHRTDWAKDLGVKTFTEGMEILYFVGCYLSYDPRNRRVAAATAKLLKRAGVDFGILGTKESCCGESIRKAGNEKVFKALARENIKTFIDHGVKRILVSSPHCYHTFKNEYSEFMMNLEVVHITQYLTELIAEGRLELDGELGKRVAYHDPCYLGRHNGVFDAPREVLGGIAGIELAELPDSRESSLCCGGGGGRIWMHTDKGERFGDLRLAQAKEVGADVLVTSCPYCISNFEESRIALGDDEPLQVKDLTELVIESLEEGETTP
jgi:Fe-S oxidoreductase